MVAPDSRAFLIYFRPIGGRRAGRNHAAEYRQIKLGSLSIRGGIQAADDPLFLPKEIRRFRSTFVPVRLS
jgi:hypothetical protein